jgi:hypothetical protein
LPSGKNRATSLVANGEVYVVGGYPLGSPDNFVRAPIDAAEPPVIGDWVTTAYAYTRRSNTYHVSLGGDYAYYSNFTGVTILHPLTADSGGSSIELRTLVDAPLCDASGAITNGAPGSGCTSTLAHGTSCSPTCDSGYTLSGTRSCSAGTLTDNAVCSGNPSSSSSYDFSGCCGAKLKHWFDFSDTSVYGTSAQSTISGFSDKLGNSASHTMKGNVEYVDDVQNGLGAMFVDRNTWGALTFSTSAPFRNP